MYRRLYANVALLSALALASGCSQMTRHSNMVVFGTNTVVGVRVGTAATQVPSIDIGYTRQEAVLMPLVANTSVSTTTNQQGNLSTALAPCDMSKDVKVEITVKGAAPPANSFENIVAPHPCLLAASNTEEGARDSYSVLASFGAQFDGSSTTAEGKAKGGLAQYFATGMAAQLLALNGGAAVVAAGDAAKASAESGKASLNGDVLLTPTKELISERAPIVAVYSGLRTALAAKVRGTQTSDLSARFGALEGALGGTKRNILASCAAPDDCADLIESDFYFENYRADRAKFDSAVAGWPLS